jgi:hypothetical protein
MAPRTPSSGAARSHSESESNPQAAPIQTPMAGCCCFSRTRATSVRFTGIDQSQAGDSCSLRSNHSARSGRSAAADFPGICRAPTRIPRSTHGRLSETPNGSPQANVSGPASQRPQRPSWPRLPSASAPCPRICLPEDPVGPRPRDRRPPFQRANSPGQGISFPGIQFAINKTSRWPSGVVNIP